MTRLEIFLQTLQIVIILYSGTLVTSEDAPDFKDPVDDPCSNNYEVNSEKRHMTEGSAPGTMCDNTWPKEVAWYKFVSNGQPRTIPTTCLKPQSCGSEVALRVELAEALPSEGEVTLAWSCGAYDVLGKYDCCVMRQMIHIKNCSNFLAYKLRRPDRCSAAFCVQDVDEPLPPSLLIKTGEDVNPVSTLPPVTSPAPDNASPVGFSALTKTRCIEGQVLCSRFPEPRCSSLEECYAHPVPTTIDTTSGDVLSTTDPRAPSTSSTSLPSGDTSTTPFSGDTSTTPSLGDTGTPLPPSDSTSDVMTNPPDTETDSDGHITTEAPPETTVVRKFYPETGSYTSTSSSTAVVTVVTGTASPAAPGVGVSQGEDSTRSTSTESVLDTETSNSSNSLVSNTVHSTTSPTETSSEKVSGTTVAMTTASVSMKTRAGSGSHFDVSSESPDVLTSGQPSPKTVDETNTSTTVTTTTVIRSTDSSSTVMSSQASSSDLQTTPALGGTIVMEFGKSKGISDLISKIETNLLGVLNANLERDHEFTSRDVHKTGTVDHERTIGVLFKVSEANLSADEMVRLLRLLNKNGQLKARDRFGADVIDIYKYGERPDKVSTSPPIVVPTDPAITKPVDTPTSKATPIDTTTDKTKDTPKTTNSSSDDTPTSAESSYSLFYDKLPLFIAIIVMTTGCVLICLFGLVYLRFYRHQRSWDTQKDMERARLKEKREKEGLDNPLPVSEMVKDEHGTRETTLALNGSHPLPADSHPPPSLCTEDEKGWIVPIDQAPPQSNFEVALRTEDTKL